jgi:hypothetical protein
MFVCVLSQLSKYWTHLERENSEAVVTHSICFIVNLDSYVKLENLLSFLSGSISYSIDKMYNGPCRVISLGNNIHHNLSFSIFTVFLLIATWATGQEVWRCRMP